jgi:hypothetical protein
MTHSGKKTDLVFLLQSISSLCYLTDVLLCSCFIVHDHDLLPNMTSNWIFNMSNITDATNGAETASPYSAPKFTGWFVWGSYGSMLIFLWSILLTIICIFSFFWPLYYSVLQFSVSNYTILAFSNLSSGLFSLPYHWNIDYFFPISIICNIYQSLQLTVVVKILSKIFFICIAMNIQKNI